MLLARFPYLFVLITLLSPPSSAQIRIGYQPIGTGFTLPVAMEQPPDGTGRFFVAELPGKIRVLHPDGTVPRAPFLDLGSGGMDRILYGSEQGLFSFAFHPDYKNNRRFFVYYARKSDGATVLSEFKARVGDPNLAHPEEKVLLLVEQPFYNHNGGHIGFGPDGYLYLSLGDGGFTGEQDVHGHAQNTDTLLGSILRLDVSTEGRYRIPPDNPFLDGPGQNEIWAYGFRNPWRFSFDFPTGRLFAGDVGHESFEEINLVERAGNYGWVQMEGHFCRDGSGQACDPGGVMKKPIGGYAYRPQRCITGGVVYRGERYPQLKGLYIFGDWFVGRLYTLEEISPGSWTQIERAIWPNLHFSHFCLDESGEAYFLDLFSGTAFRLVDHTTADLNTDYRVDGQDLTEYLRQASGKARTQGFSSGDVTRDAQLDARDLFFMTRFWGPVD